MVVRLLAPGFDAAVSRNIVAPLTVIAGAIAIALGTSLLDFPMIAGGGVLLLSSILVFRDNARESFFRGTLRLMAYMITVCIGIALIAA